MSAIAPLRVHGVPEHFNLPWRLAIEEGRFADAGLDVSWVDQPGGTGVLTARLGDGSAELATLLTEGAIASITNGLDAALVGLWTSTPLLWGAHVAAMSRIDALGDIENARFAISRHGSGSHLMAELLAADRGITLATEQLVVVGNIDGARRALADGSVDYFLWEQFMTNPLVVAGELRRVDVVPTPWPGFVVAATRSVVESDPDLVTAVCDIAGSRAAELHADPDAAAMITRRYQLEPGDAATWLELTRWAEPGPIDPALVDTVQQRLVDAGILNSALPAADLLP